MEKMPPAIVSIAQDIEVSFATAKCSYPAPDAGFDPTLHSGSPSLNMQSHRLA